jgi:uncharacterized protein (TIGR02145 family)
MTKTAILLALTFIMMSAASVNAQVTIGSMDDPHGGAVLDLSKASGNSIGFLLPRVSLENANTWQIGGDKAQGIGMVVYNTNNDVAGGDGSGIYTWNGYAWTRIKTGAEDACPRVIKDSENYTYLTGWFGAAGCWMTQNLRSTQTYHGSTLQTIPRGENSGSENLPYYYFPSKEVNILAQHPEYGLLYTWAAANVGTDPMESSDAFANKVSTRQGICPIGWHLPSDYEWNQLEKEIATNPGNYSSQTTAYANAGSFDYGGTIGIGWRPSNSRTELTYWGRQMKSVTTVIATSNFSSPNAPQGTSNVAGANGFDALFLGGMIGGIAVDYGILAAIWSSSSQSGILAGHWVVAYYSTGVWANGAGKDTLMSVRCKKDDN